MCVYSLELVLAGLCVLGLVLADESRVRLTSLDKARL